MSMIADLKERRRTDKAALESLNKRISAAPASEARAMTKKFGEGMATLEALDDRIAELDEQEAREAAAAKHRVETGTAGGRFTTNENSPYQNPRDVGVEAPSFFRDLRDARLGNQAAGERLFRNQQIRASEN